MNATEIILVFLGLAVFYLVLRLRLRSAIPHPRTSQTRLNRIKTASLLFQGVIWLCLIGSVYIYLAFLFGWPPPYHDRLRIVVSHGHIYTSPAEMPPTIYWLLMVRVGLGIFCAGVLLRLFRRFQKGLLFAAQNVTCLRFLGYWLMIDWFIDYQMQGYLKDMDLSTTPVFVGLLIIFIAWIMDEGRKIQEEQALTV
jgi:hypothetical protein